MAIEHKTKAEKIKILSSRLKIAEDRIEYIEGMYKKLKAELEKTNKLCESKQTSV